MKIFNKSGFIITFLSWSILFLIRILLGWERALLLSSDYFIKHTGRIFNRFKGKEDIMFSRLTVRSLMPYRMTHDLYKKTILYSLPIKASFATAVILRNANCNNGRLPEWKINNKTDGVHFVRNLGHLVPDQIQERISFEEIKLCEGTVIKPEDEHSAKGVFIVSNEKKIFELDSGAIYHSEYAVKKRIHQLLLSKSIINDEWNVQQFIESPDSDFATDIKFFAFYGKIEVIAEMKRYPKVLCDMFDRNNVSFDSGLYPKNKCYKGMGVSMDEIKWAEHISLEIPAPFIRIDFLRGKDGLYFCEFTPRPGSVGQFNSKYDHQLGVMFHEAEARLYNDLIKGKSFSSFKMIAKC